LAGATQQMAATLHTATTTTDVTNSCAWGSGNTGVFSVNTNTGLVTGVAAGVANVTCAYNGTWVEASLPVTVYEAPVTGVNFTRTMTFSPEATGTVTVPALFTVSGAVWSGADVTTLAGVPVSIASVPSTVLTDANGVYTFTGVPPGTHTVTVNCVTAMEHTPEIKEVANVGDSLQFALILRYADNTTLDVTNIATWELAPGHTGTITQTGLFTATHTGYTDIWATLPDTLLGFLANSPTGVTVTNANITGLDFHSTTMLYQLSVNCLGGG
jgi:hypothetical protein